MIEWVHAVITWYEGLLWNGMYWNLVTVSFSFDHELALREVIIRWWRRRLARKHREILDQRRMHIRQRVSR